MKRMVTMYKANRAFSGLRKFSAIYKHHQIVDLVRQVSIVRDAHELTFSF